MSMFQSLTHSTIITTPFFSKRAILIHLDFFHESMIIAIRMSIFLRKKQVPTINSGYKDFDQIGNHARCKPNPKGRKIVGKLKAEEELAKIFETLYNDIKINNENNIS